jgi:hypothetical protein
MNAPPKQVAARLGTGRTPKQCRERYQPLWTAAHDAALLALYDAHGPTWGRLTSDLQPVRVCTKKHVRERVAELLATRAAAVDCEAAALLTTTEAGATGATGVVAGRGAEAGTGSAAGAAAGLGAGNDAGMNPAEPEPGSGEPGPGSSERERHHGQGQGHLQQGPPPGEPPWEPVNRRRVRGKGWHIDIGPGRAWRTSLATQSDAF